jgi:uncharacterized membrane protein
MSTLATNQSETEFLSSRGQEGRAINRITWAIQCLLGVLFVFAGAMKFIMPIEEMTKAMPLPAAFLYFIGAAELAGGLGLILPGALKIRRGLTPLAAVGLGIIMCGAVVLSARINVTSAIAPLVVLVLTAFVARRRWSWLAG